MRNTEHNFPTDLPATERLTTGVDTPNEYLINPESPGVVRGRRTTEEDDGRRRGRRIATAVIGGLLVVGGTGTGIAIHNANKVTAVVNTLETTNPTEEASPAPSPEFAPINALSYELRGEAENTSSMSLDALKKQFIMRAEVIPSYFEKQEHQFGTPIIEGALQASANFEPTEEMLDEFEERAKAEFAGMDLDNVDYRKLGVVMIADHVLVPRMEALVTRSHVPEGGVDSLFRSNGAEESDGIFAKYIVDTQVKKYEASLRGESYGVNFEVLRETRVTPPPSMLEEPNASYPGAVVHNTYFSATDTNGEDLGAAYIIATTTPNNSSEKTETREDGEEIPVMTDVNGNLLVDENGYTIPDIVLDDAVVEFSGPLQELKDRYTMLS